MLGTKAVIDVGVSVGADLRVFSLPGMGCATLATTNAPYMCTGSLISVALRSTNVCEVVFWAYRFFS